ncbi:MAG: flavin reductase [Clostridiales bacterium]|jgi:flavin reductase (DIM6/NTAB) family NADH-FMN oxidoreductase RutF|nr:flavin reductase [Clostridiales bacterium]
MLKTVNLKDLNLDPFTAVGEDWMLIAAGDEKSANAMTASWGGLGVMWNKNVAYIVIRPQRYTKEFVDAAESFSLSFLGADYKDALAYMGKKSGRDGDKIKACGLTLSYKNGVPYFAESDAVLFCKKLYAQAMTPDCFTDNSVIKTCYPKSDFHTLYIGEITEAMKR